jgi:hypothetical protein
VLVLARFATVSPRNVEELVGCICSRGVHTESYKQVALPPLWLDGHRWSRTGRMVTAATYFANRGISRATMSGRVVLSSSQDRGEIKARLTNQDT